MEEIDEKTFDVGTVVVLVRHDHDLHGTGHIPMQRNQGQNAKHAERICEAHKAKQYKNKKRPCSKTNVAIDLRDCAFPYRKSAVFFLSKDRPRIFTIFMAFEIMLFECGKELVLVFE